MNNTELSNQFEDAKLLALSLSDTMGAHFERSFTNGKETGFVAINTRKLRFVININNPNIIKNSQTKLKWTDGKSYPAKRIFSRSTIL